MAEKELDKLSSQVADLGRKLEALLTERAFDAPVPLSLREAAAVCHVELSWLRERVARKEIEAYRNGAGDAWRVFPCDVRAYLMANTNMRPERRKPVLKALRRAQ